MKIRIKGNSLRYRLTRTDVEIFAARGYLAEQTVFGSEILTYALQRSEGDQLSATFKDNQITILMPAAIAKEWTGTERVGFENTDVNLHLLIEKDFKCLDNVAEDQSDNYPNPLAVTVKI
jgi:hypothetical protein